jgi:hypothetical protein
MRRRLWIGGTLALIALVTSCWLGAGALNARAAMRVAAASGAWSKAQEVPGSSALNTGGGAAVDSLSCASAGNCSAGGNYDSDPGFQAFVVNEVKGAWKKAQEVPGSSALNTHNDASINSVSCASAGNCSAGGAYSDSSDHQQAFVVNEVKGTWKKAQEVPGSGALNTAGTAYVNSISCKSAGNCSAGGYYTEDSNLGQAFVVNEVKGTWKKAQEVPGSGALNTKGNAYVNSISCTSKGNCSAVGDYTTTSGDQVFVVNEVKGTWKKAEKVPGTGSLNTDGNASINSISCTSKGNCSAGGYYEGAFGVQAFVVNEAKGTWKKAEKVPGAGALNTHRDASIDSVFCVSAGNCSAGGDYEDASGEQMFVVNEIKGTWKKAQEVPGSSSLNTKGEANVDSVSCTSAGNCSAGGDYSDSSDHQQAFVVNEVKGTWKKAEEFPGTGALNTGGGASVASVSCTSTGSCSAGGGYDNAISGRQAFVANYRPAQRKR